MATGIAFRTDSFRWSTLIPVPNEAQLYLLCVAMMESADSNVPSACRFFQALGAIREFILNVMLKRAYERPAQTDGQRILVDRLWPRGVAKVNARIDLWLKEVAPSTELRQWFGHDPEKWPEFKKRYRAELKDNLALTELRALARQGDITLIYAAKNQLNNEAVVLKQILDRGV